MPLGNGFGAGLKTGGCGFLGAEEMMALAMPPAIPRPTSAKMSLLRMGTALVASDEPTVLHLQNAVGVLVDAVIVRDGENAPLVGEHLRAHEFENLPTGVSVERGGRLIEDE